MENYKVELIPQVDDHGNLLCIQIVNFDNRILDLSHLDREILVSEDRKCELGGVKAKKEIKRIDELQKVLAKC